MMKRKLVSFFFLLFLILILVLPVKQVSAVGAGGACCAPGTTYSNGSCYNDAIVGGFCNAATSLTCLNPLAMSWCTSVKTFQGEQAVYNKCINAVTASPSVRDFCRIYSTSPAGYAMERFDPNLCETLIAPVFDNYIRGRENSFGIFSPTACDPGLNCFENMCSIGGAGVFKLCNQVEDAPGKAECQDCAAHGGIWTAIGCLPTQPTQFIPIVVTLAVGIAGGVALMLMLAGALTITLAAGNPDQVQAGKERITSAIAGLALILFSAVLLQVVGVDILKIPGF